jgi:hypothetical protein
LQLLLSVCTTTTGGLVQPALGSAGFVSSDVGLGLVSNPEGVAGWLYPPKEEVSMQSSCFTKGLLIVEKAG